MYIDVPESKFKHTKDCVCVFHITILCHIVQALALSHIVVVNQVQEVQVTLVHQLIQPHKVPQVQFHFNTSLAFQLNFGKYQCAETVALFVVISVNVIVLSACVCDIFAFQDNQEST